MLVAALSIKILIHESHSLKAKRGVVKSVKERLRNKFNISIAEVDQLDKHNFAEIGISTIGIDSQFVESTLQKAVQFMENDYRFEIVEVIRVI